MTVFVAFVAFVTLLAALSAAGAGDHRDESPPDRAGPATEVASLLTGDRVTVERLAGGRQAVTVDPARRVGDREVSFRVVEHGDQVYVVPSDAAPLVPEVLDRELFNVARLRDHGYTGGTPVIVGYHPGAAGRRAAPVGMAISTTLTSIDAVAATIAPDGRWWQGVAATDPHRRGLAGVERIWLDRQVEAALDESAPQIGASAAWDAGFDGTGTTVAVLDTGIDAGHPDLTGKVVAEADFTDLDPPGPRGRAGTAQDGPTGDAFGHGTHVAGIIAGTGAASGGRYTGVAPGAELLNGKVLDDGGTGQMSWIIAGMEWAAEQGADVADGAALRDLLAQGEVTVRLSGHPTGSSFLYDLVLPHPGQVPADLHFVADVDELATVVNGFHAGVGDHRMGEARHYFRPWTIASAQRVEPVFAPLERTEYLVPGDTRYQQQASAAQLVTEVRSVGTIQEPVTSYHPAEHRDQTWFRSPVRPGLADGAVTRRTGDTLAVRVQEFRDAHGHYGRRDTRDDIDQTEFRLYQDGQLVGQGERPQGSFPVGRDPSVLRLEVDVARDAEWWTTSTTTRTAWTVHSRRPADGSEVVPLLLVDYDAALDLTNTAPHPRDRRGPATVDLHIAHQPGADAPAVAGARAWVSYDDGDRWFPRPARRLGGGHYQVILPSRHSRDSSGFLSLRVHAWDWDGNRVEQEIARAWRQPER